MLQRAALLGLLAISAPLLVSGEAAAKTKTTTTTVVTATSTSYTTITASTTITTTYTASVCQTYVTTIPLPSSTQAVADFDFEDISSGDDASYSCTPPWTLDGQYSRCIVNDGKTNFTSRYGPGYMANASADSHYAAIILSQTNSTNGTATRTTGYVAQKLSGLFAAAGKYQFSLAYGLSLSSASNPVLSYNLGNNSIHSFSPNATFTSGGKTMWVFTGTYQAFAQTANDVLNVTFAADCIGSACAVLTLDSISLVGPAYQ